MKLIFLKKKKKNVKGDAGCWYTNFEPICRKLCSSNFLRNVHYYTISHEKCRQRRPLHFSQSTSTKLHFSTGRCQPDCSFLPGLWSTLSTSNFTALFISPVKMVLSLQIKQAMITLQEMAVFNSLYGSLAAMLVFKIT